MQNLWSALAQYRPKNKMSVISNLQFHKTVWVFWCKRKKKNKNKSPQIHHMHSVIGDGDMSCVLKDREVTHLG